MTNATERRNALDQLADLNFTNLDEWIGLIVMLVKTRFKEMPAEKHEDKRIWLTFGDRLVEEFGGEPDQEITIYFGSRARDWELSLRGKLAALHTLGFEKIISLASGVEAHDDLRAARSLAAEPDGPYVAKEPNGPVIIPALSEMGQS